MITARLYPFLAFLAFTLATFPAVDAFRRQKSNHTSVSATFTDVTLNDSDIPHVHYLVEMIGKEFYAAVNQPKYKFFIYMTVGSLPSEKTTIVLVSTICNVLYGISILIGFLFFRRGPMLVFSIATLWIGPALVLIILGSLGLMVAAFALYPMASVSVMILFFFMKSQVAQTLGKRFGLDSDQDGDVDWLDLMYVLANTELGESIGLLELHDFLHQCKLDPFKEIHLRLDRIHENTEMGNSTRDSQARLVSYEEDDSEGRNPTKKNL